MLQKPWVLDWCKRYSLSICECKKHNLANIDLFSGRPQSRFAPNRLDPCRNTNNGTRTRQKVFCKLAVLFERGLRKSSSLTNGMSAGRNKTALGEYGTEARGLDLSCDFVNASILDTPVNGSL